jgi:drug/metabolite transporter (DMT)-like permease
MTALPRIAALYLACVAIWGSTWLAITFQLGSVPPAVSVLYRFALAALLLFGYCLLRGLPLAFGARQHAALAAQGALMYSIGYVFVYHAETRVVSGLVSLGFSLSPFLNMLAVRLLLGTPMSTRVALGGLLGAAGVALVFWPEVAGMAGERRVLEGVGFIAAAVASHTLATVLATRNTVLGVPIWQALAWGMAYGTACSAVIVLVGGDSLAFEASLPYVAALLYLALFGSVVAFACYLALLDAIGPARAGYVGVMVPIVALGLSALFEGYRWHAGVWVGVALSLGGNVLMLPRNRPRPER